MISFRGTPAAVLLAVVLAGGPLLMTGPALGQSAAAAAPTPLALLGSQGSDVALPDTASAVTVPGTGKYKGMSFHLSKTTQLTNEAVSISWTGGAPGLHLPSLDTSNFVQIMQCWGDPVKAKDGTFGPPPTQCVFGANPDKLQVSNNNGFQYNRIEVPSVKTSVPFVSVDGKIIKSDTATDQHTGASIWANPYYDQYVSNEIGGLNNSGTGTGSAFFTVDTGLQSAGLGCGQPAQAGKVPQCWIVIVPRGPDDGIPGYDSRGESNTTPLDGRGPWLNRVAIPLQFIPVASACGQSNSQLSISGADLSLPAMDRWLPKICTLKDAPPYIYTRTQEDRAQKLLVARAQDPVGNASNDGMITTNQPIDPAQLPAGRHAVYAPLDVSAVVVGLTIQRAKLNGNVNFPADVTQKFLGLQGTYIQNVRLTPRLVAKLLTQSYYAYVADGVVWQTPAVKANYSWSTKNPNNLLVDPDFIAVNPEFAVLFPAGRAVATSLQVSLGSSAAATAVWNWIKADPDATRWLAGHPDDWGMQVNPYFSTTATANPSKVAFQLPPTGGFPKNDPLTWLLPDAKTYKMPALSLDNEWPYQDSLTSTAQVTRSANTGARTVVDPNNTSSYGLTGVQQLGLRAMLSITSEADAQRFGIQSAFLRNANGDFVQPDAAGVSTAVAGMTADAASGVLQTDPTKKVAGAYPLASVDYAASIPSILTAAERTNYARFLDYVAGDGQASGELLGQLPRGYVPLPAPLRTITQAVAVQVANGLPAFVSPPPTSTPTTPITTSPSASTSTTAKPAPSSSTPSSTSTPPTSTTPTTASSADTSDGNSTAPVTVTTSTPVQTPVAAANLPPEQVPPAQVPPTTDSQTGTDNQTGAGGLSNQTSQPPGSSSPTAAAPVGPGVTAASSAPTVAGGRPAKPSGSTPRTSGQSTPEPSAPASAAVTLASATTPGDRAPLPWTALIFLIGVGAAVAVPALRAMRRTRGAK